MEKRMIPAVTNYSDPEWECIMKVLLRIIKKFTKQKGQHWEHGQTPDARPQSGSSAFYTAGVPSAWCIFILILRSLTPNYSPCHWRSFITVVLKAVTGRNSAPFKVLSQRFGQQVGPTHKHTKPQNTKPSSWKPTLQLGHWNNINHSTTHHYVDIDSITIFNQQYNS